MFKYLLDIKESVKESDNDKKENVKGLIKKITKKDFNWEACNHQFVCIDHLPSKFTKLFLFT